MPDYSFICPKCGIKTKITMRISQYHADGHICKCGAELKRNIQDTARDYIVNTDGFYGKTSM